MKMIILIISLFVLSMLYIKKRSIALWTADPMGQCLVEDVKYGEKSEDDFYINYSVYSHKKSPAKKSILVIPPTGGKNIIDEGYALNLCRRGFKVYILEGWKNIKEYELDYSIHQIYQDRTQRAFVKMVEVMDGDKVGVLGTSAGGINFSVSLGNKFVAQKVDAFFSIVAGTPLCKVIASSHEKGLKGIRELRFEKTDVASMEQYEKNICGVLKWRSPERLPGGVAYGAIVSMKDVTVATEYQLEMVENYQPKTLIKSNLNHFRTVVSSYFLHKKAILEFFET